MKTCIFVLSLLSAVAAHAGFVPDFKVKPDDYTVLLVADAKCSEGLKPLQSGGHGKFFMTGWNQESQKAVWDVTVEQPGEYAVNVLIKQNKTPQEISVQIDANGKKTSALLPEKSNGWERLSLPGVALAKGPVTFTLQLKPTSPNAPFDASVHALELVRPAVRELLHQKALAQRSDTGWFQQAKYGIFVHWTWQTQPRTGKAKPYAQAVEDFNIPAFVAQMKNTGAGFVVLTTSHAFQSIPAPIAALDKIMPGRTTKRDLIGELADALNKEGIRLMLYYHLGAMNDSQWLQASGFWETDTTKFFTNWQAIIRETGERYGNRLAGWWFDDGTTNYYYRSAPWEKLAAAAKAGNPNRLIGFNPWTMPSATEFQDFYCGEGNRNPGGPGDLLQPGGNGHYPSGTFSGLQGSACVTFDGDWVHMGANREIRKPKLSPERLADFLKKCITRKNVPMFNLEIYQDGTVSPASVETFQKARTML